MFYFEENEDEEDIDNEGIKTIKIDINKINNIIFMKIDDYNNKILLEERINLEDSYDNLYYIKKDNLENFIIAPILASNNKEYEEVIFYKLINIKNNKILKINFN